MSKNERMMGFSMYNMGKPDQSAHGEAALLLTESLIHGLCELTMISIADAVNIVDRAASVQLDRVTELDSPNAILGQSHALLARIANSLRADLKTDPSSLKCDF